MDRDSWQEPLKGLISLNSALVHFGNSYSCEILKPYFTYISCFDISFFPSTIWSVNLYEYHYDFIIYDFIFYNHVCFSMRNHVTYKITAW